MNAKFYIYRNLHKNCFSVRLLGRVIDHVTDALAFNVEFKVNQLGRLRVLTEQHKNVHAFVVAESYVSSKIDTTGLTRVSYNPYKSSFFESLREPIFKAPVVLFSSGKCYLLDSKYLNEFYQNIRPEPNG